ncbi:unnamed protein product [Spirodela intermedia]|uniref:Uncharacterized protein n=1 Tax=Spirodela intermedia TaxID=51605 RepID=A0A7I8JVT8_SPIIN|nr:unnamed protein product [Spirodela intermedia]
MYKDSKPERKRKKNAHQYNSDASSPVQTRNEEEQPSYFGVAEHALSTDSAVSFHLIEIKEEVLETDSYDIDNVVPAVNISASSSVSPEVACTVRSETLQAESFGEHDPVTVSDCSASDLLAECHFPDNMWDCLNNGCSLGPASTTEDRSVQATDSIENPIAIQVTSETSEASGSFLSVDHSDQGGDVIFTFEDVSEASTPVAMVLDVGKVRDMSAEISTADDRKTHQESDEELHHQLEHPPIKLLSNRKVLSPTTQEKLCQAVDAEEPVKPPKSGKRLWFEGKSNGSPPRDPVLRLSGLVPSPERIGMAAPGKRLWFERRSNWATSSEWIHRVPDTTTSPERASKRPKNGSVVPTKGILKSPPSWAVNSPAQKHTQEAITFSQRQMQDIESLASKLLKGLRSMKGIVEEALISEESSSAASLKDQTDKMRAAIDNASELEETTKKWLSMMGKDCNRFCKILRSTLQKTPNGLRKDRKKITFADEAGGMLCHVKLFEDIV